MGQAGLKRIAVLLATLGVVPMSSAPTLARQRMSFVPGHYSGYTASIRRQSHATWRKRFQATRAPRERASPKDTTAGKPGQGFTMVDGVLTYPAPARFQPRNLKP